MYTELIQRCKQMYLTESDGEDDSFYQLPSFLDSIASVLIHLDKVWPNLEQHHHHHPETNWQAWDSFLSVEDFTDFQFFLYEPV